MSGPKYYNFPVGSAEEAAGIYAQLSAFQHGVKIKVVNNELRFEVSESAWYQGATYSSIQSEINKAKNRYAENEELKRLLKENKQKEKAKIKTKIASIDSEYKQEKSKLEQARIRCAKIRNDAVLSYTTPFGTYDLSSELSKVKDIEITISSELASLSKRREDAIRECHQAESSIDSCDSMKDLSSIQRVVESIGLDSSNTVNSIDDVETSIKEKSLRLKNFVSFLNKLYDGMKNKELTGYFDRIKKEVAGIDIFDVDAPKKIENILTSIESEIALLKEKEISLENNREVRERVSAQLRMLDDLSRALKPVLEAVVVENEVSADYSKKSIEIIKECDEIFARIKDLEFINGENRGRVDKLSRELLPLRNSTMSKTTIDRLTSILTTLHNLEDVCKKGNEIYKKFKEEYKIYEELYVKLQGFLSAGDSVVNDDVEEQFLLSPIEVVLAYENPEKQIELLKKKNEELAKIVSECTQEGLCGAIAATVTAVKDNGKSQGEPFKKEKHKDGSLHFTYIRKENQGAIFDVECGVDGRVGIYPRGVVLCNGKTTISPDELKVLHSSCGWADEIHEAFDSFGMSHSGSYEEMPSEVLQSLYDIKNYYHISTFEESVRFLELSGYSQEAIETILEIEKEENTEERKRKRNIIANRAHAIKK